MTGRSSFADCVTIYFKAEVNHLIGDRNLSVVYVNHPELTGFFRFSITGDSGFLAVFATLGRDGARNTHVAEDITEARCVELVRTALGSEPDLPVAVESVQRWSAMAATADSFQRGRVFLAGDAAHVMPPTGGFGGNTGVADAHNLAWKLAYVTRGIAGPGLLDTYSAERRPIAALTVEQAYARYAMRVDPSLPRDDLMPPLDDAAIELGAICRSSAVHADTAAGIAAEQLLDDPHARTWTVGARLPHLPLAGDGTQNSTLDAAGPGIALLTDQGLDLWRRAAGEVQETLGVAIDVTPVDPGSLSEPADPPAAAAGTGWTGAALIRPDGVIGWKPHPPAAEAVGQLGPVVAGLLSRSGP
jgi:hypothetical protein